MEVQRTYFICLFLWIIALDEYSNDVTEFERLFSTATFTSRSSVIARFFRSPFFVMEVAIVRGTSATCDGPKSIIPSTSLPMRILPPKFDDNWEGTRVDVVAMNPWLLPPLQSCRALRAMERLAPTSVLDATTVQMVTVTKDLRNRMEDRLRRKLRHHIHDEGYPAAIPFASKSCTPIE